MEQTGGMEQGKVCKSITKGNCKNNLGSFLIASQRADLGMLLGRCWNVPFISQPPKERTLCPLFTGEWEPRVPISMPNIKCVFADYLLRSCNKHCKNKEQDREEPFRSLHGQRASPTVLSRWDREILSRTCLQQGKRWPEHQGPSNLGCFNGGHQRSTEFLKQMLFFCFIFLFFVTFESKHK